MLSNLPQVTKNILLLNITMFVVKLVLQTQGIDLDSTLGAHYVNSPLFEPFQVVTYFFMHGDFFHILMNMWVFVTLGTYLERLWGPKRFFIFYVITAIGAFAIYNTIGAYHLYELKQQLSAHFPIEDYNSLIQNYKNESPELMFNKLNELFKKHDLPDSLSSTFVDYYYYSSATMVGASGAIFGIVSAFAILFPNTEFLIYFTIPVKAKYLAIGYFLLELYLSFQHNPSDNVAHLAHVGGAVVGAIIVLFWRKTDRLNFW